MTSTTIAPELLDQLLANYETPEDLTGNNGLFKRLKKAADRTRARRQQPRRLEFEVGSDEVPRDRAGSFDPQLIPKGQRRFDGFDDKILSLYERGMTVGEIQGHLAELYGAEVSPDLISRVTDAVLRGLGDADARHAARRQRRCVQGARHRRPRSRARPRQRPGGKVLGSRARGPGLPSRPAEPRTKPPVAQPPQAPARFQSSHPFKALKDDVLRFLVDFDVPFTNNLAEQDIRMTKVKMKISGAFRTLDGARDFACLGSIVSTTRK